MGAFRNHLSWRRITSDMTTTKIISQLMDGMWISLEIFAVTLVTSLILGLILCMGRISRFSILRMLIRFYISVMRGTPLLLQLMVVYFGPNLLFGIKISSGYRLTAVLIGFSLNYAAYFAEIYRAGIESVPKGQYEAAKVLGYTKAQTFFLIVMPQVIKRVLPPVTNETITLVKDTSLAFGIAVAEMFTTAKQIAASQASMMPYLFAALFYYIFNLIIAAAFSALEKKLSYY